MSFIGAFLLAFCIFEVFTAAMSALSYKYKQYGDLSFRTILSINQLLPVIGGLYTAAVHCWG